MPPPSNQNELHHRRNSYSERKDRGCTRQALTFPSCSITPINALDLLKRSQSHDNQPPLALIDNDSKENRIPWLELHPGLYEIVGEAGTGKTQVAISLLCRAALNTIETTSSGSELSSNSSSSPACRGLYLALGAGAPQKIGKMVRRLQQMIENNCRPKDCQATWNSLDGADYGASATSSVLLSRILTRAVIHTEQWWECLQCPDLSGLLQQHAPHLRVIVIDSLADLFRGPSDTQGTSGRDHSLPAKMTVAEATLRSQHFFSLTSLLNRWVSQYSLVILVLNQVTGTPGSHFSVTPALGLSWAHCVHHSFTLTRYERSESDQEGAEQSNPRPAVENHHSAIPNLSERNTSTGTSFRRQVTLTRSSRFQCGQCANFTIDYAGVHIISR